LTSNSSGQVNVLVVEISGASRMYFNGAEASIATIANTLCGAGINLGGKQADGQSYLSGVIGEVAVFPATFTGDAWDRVTQGTMWKWQQQAKIAGGATYKGGAPMVTG
jgi:hypothetical protein